MDDEDETPPDLEAVFVGPTADKPPPMPAQDGGDEAEMEAALDAAIDEAFDAEDPVARREAFKRAMRLCNDMPY